MPKYNIAAKKENNFQLCQQSSKTGTKEQPLYRHCSTSHQQRRKTPLPPKNKTTFNCANNHQKLALMNNLCFGTVVLAIKSAEVQHWRRNTKKLNSDEKHHTLVLLNSCFGTFVPLNCAEAQYCFRKTKKVKQCLKSSKVGVFEQHSFRRCCTNAQQCRNTTLPPKKK